MDYYSMTDDAIVEELGNLLQKQRLKQNLSQQQLADKAGLNRTTISYFENGRPGNTLTLIQILRGLEMLDILDHLKSTNELSPLQLMKLKGKERKRASGKNSKPQKSDSEW